MLFSGSRCYEIKKEFRNEITRSYSNLPIFPAPTDKYILSVSCPGQGYSYPASDHKTSDVTCMVKKLQFYYFVTTRIIP